MSEGRQPHTGDPASATQRVMRFGCGVVLGAVLVLATLLGTGWISLAGPTLDAIPWGIATFAIAAPLILGVLAMLRGDRFIEHLLRFIGKAG